MRTYLVSVSPKEVLGADVLEGVLDALLERGHVRDVLPVLGPQTPGVDAGDAEGGDHNAVRGQVVRMTLRYIRREGVLLDGELAPGVCKNRLR